MRRIYMKKRITEIWKIFVRLMVMPNIGAFIAWGFITAFLILMAGCQK